MPLSSTLIQGFSGSCLVQKYDRATAIPDVHKEWWDICCSTDPLVAIAAPRGHGKSTALTFAYTLASVLFRDRKFVLIVSDTETQASMFLGDLKRELIDNEDIVNLFQIKKFTKDSETDIIVQFEDGKEFRIIARGAEQRVRGLKWRAARPDLIICHEEGTEIFTEETGWIKNTDHPKARKIHAHEAFKIEFEDGTTEVISGDHRYWIEGLGWKFAWELKPEMSVLNASCESTTKLIEKNIKNAARNSVKGMPLLSKVKRGVRNTYKTILVWVLLVSGRGMKETKNRFVNKLLSSLKRTLLGKLHIVLKEEQGNSKRFLLG